MESPGKMESSPRVARLPRIIAITACISTFLLLGIGLAWKGHQDSLLMGDLLKHHLAGLTARDHGLTAIYRDSNVGRELADALGKEPDFDAIHWNYLYPPLVAWVCRLCAGWPYELFCLAWFYISFSAYLLILWFARRLFPAIPRGTRLAAAIGLPVVYYVFLIGQNSLVLLLIYFASAWLLSTRRPLLAGIVVSCAFFKPNWLVYAAWFLLCLGQWRWLAGLALGGAFWGALSLLLASWEPHLAWLQVLGEMSRGGQLMPDYFDHSLGGFLRRSFPAIPSLFWTPAMLGILAFLARRRTHHLPWEQLLLGLAAAVTFSTYTMFYDTVFGLGAFYLLLEREAHSWRGRAALALFWVGSMIGANPEKWDLCPGLFILLAWQLLLFASPLRPPPD